jgi:hypothetical protein
MPDAVGVSPKSSVEALLLSKHANNGTDKGEAGQDGGRFFGILRGKEEQAQRDVNYDEATYSDGNSVRHGTDGGGAQLMVMDRRGIRNPPG